MIFLQNLSDQDHCHLTTITLELLSVRNSKLYSLLEVIRRTGFLKSLERKLLTKDPPYLNLNCSKLLN